VFVHGPPDLNQLTEIVDYFCSPEWQSFTYKSEEVNNSVALASFNKRLEKAVGSSVLVGMNPIEVWRLNELNIQYDLKGLKLYYKDQLLAAHFSNPLPVQIKDRFIFTHEDQLHVVANGQIILEYPLPKGMFADDAFPTMEALEKWVNISQFGKAKISYSYQQNRFILVPQD